MSGQRISELRESIAQACRRRGRNPSDVTLLVVTKTVPAERVQEIFHCGVTDIGESRIQEAQQKFPLLPLKGIRKHLIGHLQTNKVKKALTLFDVIQSVDSLYLAREIDAQAVKAGKTQECLVEVNISGEEAKYGVNPDEVRRFLESVRPLAHVSVTGLMTMAPFFDDPELARPYFKRMKTIFDTARAFYGEEFKNLSMGMSGDYAVAIEEGATIVRVGTAIFGER